MPRYSCRLSGTTRLQWEHNPFPLLKCSSSKRTQASHPNSPPAQASSQWNCCYKFLLVNTIFLGGPLLYGGRQEQMETNSDRKEIKRTENVEEQILSPYLNCINIYVCGGGSRL